MAIHSEINKKKKSRLSMKCLKS